MPRKKRSVPRSPAQQQIPSLGAPISDEMFSIIDSMKNCTATGKEAEEMLGQAVRKLLHASLDQMAKQREMSLHNHQHTS